MVTDRLSTVILSPAFSCLKIGVPPDATNNTLSLAPLIFWRKHPNPAQQQVLSEQSRSQPVKIKMIDKNKPKENGEKYIYGNALGSFVQSIHHMHHN
jgi:hypothetical protein